MHSRYFPPCPVDGPIDPPVAFGHVCLTGAVPAKCAQCPHLFEGECTRYIEDVGQYLHLDYGPCGINGSTDPVTFENQFVKAKVEVPRKCATCRHLAVHSIHGFHCTKDSDKWGDFHRGLDWGSWRPDFVYLQLPLPKITTRELSQHAFANDLVAFVREHRRINPGLAVEDAKNDFQHFRTVIESSG
jgi:hypothetical protein